MRGRPNRGRVRGRRLAPHAGILAIVVLALAGCGGNGENALHPHSHAARDIASLWWWMLGGAALGLALVVGFLVAGYLRRHRRGLVGDKREEAKPSEQGAWRLVVGLGVVMPIAVVTTLFAVSQFFVIHTTEAPAATSTAMTVDVVGHQWWWEIRYPGSRAVTANEIHIPARTRVNLVATTADVIHSFWVPELNRKIDTIPGERNRILLYADKPGVYRGRCSEYCGLQHAHMQILVFAQPAAQFRAWLARAARPAPRPIGTLALAGERIFTTGPCQSCHTIRGTSADGVTGPDLTHVGARTTLAAGTIPNRRDDLARWITDSQHVKPGNQMPDLELGRRQVRALVTYLRGLR